MMRTAPVLIVLVAIYAVSYAIVCTPNICDSITCHDEVESSCCVGELQEYQPTGGFCGCCGLCVTYIPVNGTCSNLFFGLSFPPKTRCITGTQCLNRTCQVVS